MVEKYSKNPTKTGSCNRNDDSFGIVAFACAIFIPRGMKTKPYEFLEKEIIETEYGVTGMVKERKQKYQGKTQTTFL